MSSSWELRRVIHERVAAEKGTIVREAARRVALVYPSPYHVGMSSLGFQTIYRIINQLPGHAAERAFLPDDVDTWRRAKLPLVTYESERPVAAADIIALSVAYELELTGVVDVLELSGLLALASERDERHPLVIAGGPLTFSNPLPLGPFVDVVVLGEAEATVGELLLLVESFEAGSDGADRKATRARLLDELARRPGFWVPAIHGERLPPIAAADDALLPAHSQILTPHTELASMFLIEPERGCSRGCTYCVMRRSTNGGMRLMSPGRVLSLIPDEARKVGLVGAAVTDHPRLPDILRDIVAGGREVGISSLRADRLTDEIVGLLAAGGYRAITFASDGASERLRKEVMRGTKERHLLAAAALAKKHGMLNVKVYQMVGLPGETEDDIDEMVRVTREMAQTIKVVLGVSPFVAKRNTPLDGAPYEGIAAIERKLERLRRGLSGVAEVRPTSARWAWVEFVLASGGMEAGRRALAAHRAGGGFAAWKKAFADVAREGSAPSRDLRVVR